MSAYSSLVLADSPVGYWRLGEPSGTTAQDATANNRDGTYTNTPTLGVTGLIVDSDTCVTFNGSNEYVAIADANDWSVFAASAGTIECWLKPAGLPGTQTNVVSKAGAAAFEWDFQYASTGEMFARVLVAGGSPIAVVTLGTLAVGTTYHLAMTWDGTTVRGYLNGQPAGTPTTLGGVYTSGTGALAIGRRADGSQYFNGTIDEVAIYPTQLSAARIEAHYDLGLGVYPSMPDRVVEVSFTGSDTSPAWVNITPYVQGISTSRGRDHELDEFGPGTMNVALMETGSRVFDPEYSAGPYFGHLIPNRPIRFQANWLGTTYSVFRGYVDKWPQTYTNPGIDHAQITATDGFKILNRLELGSSGYASTVTAQAADHWYRLGEPADMGIPTWYQAVDAVGGMGGLHQYNSMEDTRGLPSLIYGDEDTAISVAHSLNQRVLVPKAVLTAPPFTVTAVIQSPDTHPEWLRTIFSGIDAGLTSALEIGIRDATGTYPGAVELRIGGGPVVVYYNVYNTQRVDDDVVHHVAVVVNSTTSASIYIDGSGANRAVFTSGSVSFPDVQAWWAIGNYVKTAAGDFGFGEDAVLDEVAIWHRSLTETEITGQADAVNGYAGDTPGERVQRILDLVDWPSSLTSIEDDPDLSLSAWLPDAGSNAMEEVRAAWSDTEHGPMFVDGDGVLTFYNRGHIFSTTESIVSNCTFGDSTGELPYVNVAFDTDDTLLRNAVTGRSKQEGDVIVTDTTSIATYYRQGHSLGDSYAGTADVTYAAQYEVENHKDIKTRLSELRINPQTDTNGMGPADLYPQLLGRDFGDRITVVRRPLGIGSAITKTLLLEHISHDVTTDEWHTSWKASPPPGEYATTSSQSIQGYLVLDHATRGRLNYNRLGL